ncbi:MAG: 3',5'-cyclic-nucleotide phosphodiesterase [Spirochaetia bacterium]|nr:3',5'-cyclic-nucleotide phosphodiesterase [Spirochaetia bacterium]
MIIKTLGCHGGQLPGRNLTGFLVNGEMLIDGGTVAMNSGLSEQRRIRNILVSHAHLDHTNAIPFFAVNIVSNKTEGVSIAGSAYTLDAIKNHLMNDIIWPDFTKIKNFGGKYVFSYKQLKLNKWEKVGAYRVMAVPVNHTIQCTGFLIGKGNSYIMYSGDTKETEAIWAEAKKLGKKLKAVFVDVAFPDRAGFLAESSCHLTPASFAGQLHKLGGLKPKVFVYHLKPEYLKEIRADMKKIKGYKITIMEDGKTYKI